MLPRLGGFDVLKELRKRNVETPVIMLTARGQVVDKVVGLKLGADDYVTKPFEMMELLARIEAKLQPERIRSTLAFAGLYQITHGLIQQAVLNDLHDIFFTGLDERGMGYDEGATRPRS